MIYESKIACKYNRIAIVKQIKRLMIITEKCKSNF